MTTPIPMVLHCPECKARHIDEGPFATKPHHTHSCQNCGLTWRPAVVSTVGVQFLPGFKNPADPRALMIEMVHAWDRFTRNDEEWRDGALDEVKSKVEAMREHINNSDTILSERFAASAEWKADAQRRERAKNHE